LLHWETGNEERKILSAFFSRTLFLLSHLSRKEHAITTFEELEQMVGTKIGVEEVAGNALNNTFTLEKGAYSGPTDPPIPESTDPLIPAHCPPPYDVENMCCAVLRAPAH
jgi:hypothetical protein